MSTFVFSLFQNIVYYASSFNVNKQILALLIGNNQMHKARLLPDSTEVQQMKAEAAEKRAAKEAER